MERVILTFDVYWRFKDYNHLKITKCKKIINTLNNKMLKYNKRGFYIEGKYYKRKDLGKMIEKIPIETDLPF